MADTDVICRKKVWNVVIRSQVGFETNTCTAVFKRINDKEAMNN